MGGWGHNNDVGLHRLDRRFVAVAASSFFPQGGLSFAGALGLSYMLLLLRVGKFRDIGELPPNLKNWFLVVVFYVDSLLVCAGLSGVLWLQARGWWFLTRSLAVGVVSVGGVCTAVEGSFGNLCMNICFARENFPKMQ